MTQRKYCISAGQLFSILFVNRSVIMLTFNTLLGGGSNLLDNILSAVLALGINFIAIIPLYFLYRRNRTENVLDLSEKLLGKPGMILFVLLYGLYFMAIDSYYLSFFQLFLNNVMEPLMPVWLIAFAIVAVICYTAYQGIEAVARTAGFVLVIMVIGIVWIGVALLPKIQTINYEPLLYNGPEQMLTGTALFLARSTGFATMALLLPRVHGKKKRGFVAWNVGVYSLISFLILGMVGVGGSYLKNQLFPVYTAAALADAGILERLDVVFITIWAAGLIIQMSTDAYLFMTCVRKATNKMASRIVLPFGAVTVAVLSVLTTKSLPLQRLFYGVPLLFILTCCAAVLFPGILLVVDVVKKKKLSGKDAKV
ncbi:GerAB/ArcD/ProY family transporter [Clostridium sp. D33t1_170424_F3]|uniref:GerAB/ArcD/ProY family transporter n=1 Tax=Clostridium sp. D33t1_170424_F3 TaxID=2787099 RepID=UPI0018AAAB14|nr:GerAB/ArcD/ProY family transporter [Clostridium sp. D33t1_170424_F3]